MTKFLSLTLFSLVLSLTAAAHSPISRIVDRTAPDVVVLQDLEGDTFCSGFIVQNTGLIATAAHCVDAPFLVRWKGQLFGTKLVALDPIQDVALLQPRFGPLSNAVGIPFAKAAPSAGDPVVIVGHHLGWEHTVTTGIISNEYRELGDEGKIWVQTSAFIAGGASGGVALNEDGQIIGLVSFTMVDRTYCNEDPFCSTQTVRTSIGGLVHLDSIKSLFANRKH